MWRASILNRKESALNYKTSLKSFITVSACKNTVLEISDFLDFLSKLNAHFVSNIAVFNAIGQMRL